jgi:hypothetical protein
MPPVGTWVNPRRLPLESLPIHQPSYHWRLHNLDIETIVKQPAKKIVFSKIMAELTSKYMCRVFLEVRPNFHSLFRSTSTFRKLIYLVLFFCCYKASVDESHNRAQGKEIFLQHHKSAGAGIAQ